MQNNCDFFCAIGERLQRVLNRHNIKYWATFGTLLGSIREGKILSFDDPKASIESNLEKYLFDSAAIEINKDIKIYTDIDGSKFIEYEAVLDSGERVKVYRKVKFIGSRTVRLVTLGLSWLENKKSILDDLENTERPILILSVIILKP